MGINEVLRRRSWGVAGAALLLLLLLPAVAAAAEGALPSAPPRAAWFPTDMVWAWVAGNLAPLVSYGLNRFWSTAPEAAKGLVMVVTAAVAGVLADLVTSGEVGFNDVTFQMVVTAVVAALAGHAWFWTRTEVPQRIGARPVRHFDPVRR